MQLEVNGTRLWFDADGPVLVPDGGEMRLRPTVVLVHGGPGGWDHSYFKPDFAPLTDDRTAATQLRGISKRVPTTSVPCARPSG
jgi:pimeloyl-ACP methyl ester carboxylesterase